MKLKELRNLKGLSQRDLAKKLNLTSTTIGKYENGQCDPNIENLIKMSKIFGVSVDTLVGNDAELLDLTALDEKRKYAVKKIVYALDDLSVAQLIGYMDK